MSTDLIISTKGVAGKAGRKTPRSIADCPAVWNSYHRSGEDEVGRAGKGRHRQRGKSLYGSGARLRHRMLYLGASSPR